MHPVLASRRRLLVYLVAALAFSALVSVGLAGPDSPWWVAALVFVPTTVAYAVVCLWTWYLCRVFPLDTQGGAWRAFGSHALASVFASAAWGIAIGAWIDLLGRLDVVNSVYTGREPSLFVVGVLVYGLITAVHYLLITVEASRETERRALELNLTAREAELKALRAQLDPHFLFNSLHSISALTTTDATAAREMCLLLADFLRDTLRLGAHHRIPLADEFALADRFLAIEQIRFGPRLRVLRRSADDVDACLVPPLILQPLVENAVLHGVSQVIEGGTIEMTAERSDAVLTITLENPCDPDRRRGRGTGLGLDLLRRRLSTQFGVADAVLVAEHSGRYRVEVRLPVVLPA